MLKESDKGDYQEKLQVEKKEPINWSNRIILLIVKQRKRNCLYNRTERQSSVTKKWPYTTVIRQLGSRLQ